MILRKFFFTSILIIFSFAQIVFAQHPELRPGYDNIFERGLELMYKNQWASARITFGDYLQKAQDHDLKAAEAEYYRAYCALQLFNDDAEALMENFVQNNSTHPKAILAYYELGKFYYNNKKYDKAASFYEKVNPAQLTQSQQEDVNFALAYTYFSKKDFDKALDRFNVLKRTENKYTYASSYYAGYINYTKGNYDQAIFDLKKAEKNEAYSSIAPPIIANIYYKQGRYDELLAYTDEILKDPRVKNKSEMELLAAEAYYQKGSFEKAATLYQDYSQSKGKVDDGVRYRMAFSQFKSGNPERAIDNFKKVADGSDTLSQFASYYLGRLYVKQENLPFAQTAFKKAATLSFNEDIKQESAFLLGKTNYDLGNYDQAISQLKSFQDDYPKSKYTKDANELLSKALLKSNNYEQAVAYIEKLPNKSLPIRKAYQEVTFLRGTELFNAANFYPAVQMFKKSLEYPEDNELQIKANYWAAEAYSIGKKWDDAINSYAGVFRVASPKHPLHLASRYGIGYAYYNTKQYDKALVHFKEYVGQGGTNPNYYKDAILRLADTYYANKVYSSAISNYQKALDEDSPEKDYAYFQLGLVYGLNGQEQKAIDSWNIVITKYSKSPYADDAIFNKAQLFLESGKYSQAIEGFTKIIREEQNSPFVPYALRNRALAYFNLKNYDQSVQDYAKILNEYPDHKIANSALIGLQEVLAIQNKSDEFDKYLAKYKKANPSDKSLESVEFESAKTLYFNQKYDKAIAALKNYLQTYPGTANTNEAKFYIAEAYFRNNQLTEAVNYYEDLARTDKTSRGIRAIQRVAEIAYQNGNYQKAVDFYRQLEESASNKRQQSDAWLGLMESYFKLNNHEAVNTYADLLLEKGGTSANASNKALLYKGKAAYAQGRFEDAKKFFKETTSAAKDENGAEAQYMLALIQHNQKQYKESVETLFNLNSNYSIYTYWLGKSFILIAENYREIGEIFQAKETLKSVIENSKLPEIVAEAKAKLKAIESKQQKAAQDTVTNQ